MKFNGYKRHDGSVGIRNKTLIIATDECCEGIVQNIAKASEEAVVLTNYMTCMLGGNEETYNQLVAVSKNPNVANVIIVAMGCGSIDPNTLKSDIGEGKSVEIIVAQKSKGTRNSIQEGQEILKRFRTEADAMAKEECDMSSLIVGIKCGGSDTSSGLAANPAVGEVSDRIIKQGGITIGGELFELIGCEESLSKRSSKEVSEKINRLIDNEKRRYSVEGVETETMSIGNGIGGLTTIEEKSLGALYKFGSENVVDVLEINHNGVDKPKKSGLYLSEATMLCGGANVNFASFGAQLILWTTASAGVSNPLVPVITVSGNESVINDDIDVDASGIINGKTTLNEVADNIIDKIEKTCNGEKTSIEGLGTVTLTLYQKDRRTESFLNIRNCK